MPSLTRKPKFAADQLVVCIESFATSLDDEAGGCAAGTRLLGGHPKVIARPHLFADASLPDDELHKLRADLYPYLRLERSVG